MRKQHQPPVASSVSTGSGAGFVGLCSIQLSYGCKAPGNTPTPEPAQEIAPRKYRPRGESLIDRISAQLDTSGGLDACWPWLGRLSHDGYGVVERGPVSYLTHRVILASVLGRSLGPDEVSRHRCNNRPCGNPRHLQPGSRADNAADMVAADRQAYGERSGSAKLTEEQVTEIRRRAPEMGYGKYEYLGRIYGVTGKQIAHIIRGQRWAHAAVSQ